MKQESKVWAVSSLICGVLGLLLFLMPYLGIVLSILAIVFYSKQKDLGMAKAGLVTGIVGLVINAVFLLILAFVLLLAL